MTKSNFERDVSRAKKINAYWARYGVRANARVEDGGIVSDLVQRVPKTIGRYVHGSRVVGHKSDARFITSQPFCRVVSLAEVAAKAAAVSTTEVAE